MTGEVKRYYATSPYSGNEPELVVTWADHLAVVEGLRDHIRQLSGERFSDRNHAALQSRATTAEAVVEGLRADAERYRWLRNHGLVASDPQTADELDAAIDEAMRHDP